MSFQEIKCAPMTTVTIGHRCHFHHHHPIPLPPPSPRNTTTTITPYHYHRHYPILLPPSLPHTTTTTTIPTTTTMALRVKCEVSWSFRGPLSLHRTVKFSPSRFCRNAFRRFGSFGQWTLITILRENIHNETRPNTRLLLSRTVGQGQ